MANGKAMKIAVTGGASGIGAATVAHLAAAGHAVTVFDRAKPDGDTPYIPLDLLDADSITAALAEAGDDFGGLCHIAGIPPTGDNAEACLRVNALGAFDFISGFMPKLGDGAAVVSVASRAGAGWQENTAMLDGLLACRGDESGEAPAAWIKEHGIDATAAYKISKQAMIYFMQLQVSEFIGRNRFVTVSPSAVDTAILGDFIRAFGVQAEANIERVGRPGKAEEIAAVIGFLVSPAARWINGVDIIADGGMGALNLGQ